MVLQGLTDLQDRILPLSMDNSFKRLFKRSLKVSSRHITCPISLSEKREQCLVEEEICL